MRDRYQQIVPDECQSATFGMSPEPYQRSLVSWYTLFNLLPAALHLAPLVILLSENSVSASYGGTVQTHRSAERPDPG